jgi:flavorubredoxin
MQARKIDEGVWWVGAMDWDRRLFDSLIPLPDGTSYNAYLIKGSRKTALVDTVDPAKA